MAHAQLPGIHALLEPDSSNRGILTLLPPFNADSCAQIPAAVQLAAVISLIQGLRFSTMLRTNS